MQTIKLCVVCQPWLHLQTSVSRLHRSSTPHAFHPVRSSLHTHVAGLQITGGRTDRLAQTLQALFLTG